MTKEKETTINAGLPLDQFISQVLSNIRSGIKGQNLQHGKQHAFKADIDVKFDILVNVSQITEGQTSGGLGIKVAGILSVGNIEAGKSNQETHSASNKLSFAIPLSVALDSGKPKEES